MKRVIHKSRLFTLSKENKPKPDTKGKGPQYYIISWTWWAAGLPDQSEIRKLLDPTGDNSRNSHSCEYRDKVRAEQLYTMAVIKWP